MTRQTATNLTAFSMFALLTALCGCSSTNPRVKTSLNEEAALVGNLPRNPLKDKVITSWIDRSDMQHPLMSTLYGNDVAVQYARTNSSHDYPAGAVLSTVTWMEREDNRWFGGNIPSAPQFVEIVTLGQGDTRTLSYRYQRFEGNPLRQTADQLGAKPSDRAAFLLNQRAAVMP
jgi:hypothetical protein